MHRRFAPEISGQYESEGRNKGVNDQPPWTAVSNVQYVLDDEVRDHLHGTNEVRGDIWKKKKGMLEYLGGECDVEGQVNRGIARMATRC